MIELDGSYGEGGGALVRTALALATLTGKEFSVKGIRSGRPKPGLKAQHLTAINALKEMSAAETNEIQLGSTELEFKPGKIKRGKYSFDIGTAGSISLLLQALLPPCLFAPGKITLNIKGGTCGKWQASVDYIQNLLLPQLRRFVEKIELKIIKRGYFPKGGGEIQLEVTPRFNLENYDNFVSLMEEIEFKICKIKLENQGELEQIKGVINLSSELEEKEVGERIQRAVINQLSKHDSAINIRVEYAKSFSVGGEVLLWAIFSNDGKVDFDNPVLLGSSVLVEKGKTSEAIGKEVALLLEKEITSKSAVDHFLGDQLIAYMGLLPGSKINVSEISNHANTNIYIVEKFLPVGFRNEGSYISTEKN